MSSTVVTTRPVSFTGLSPEDEPDTTYDLPAGTVLTTAGAVDEQGRQPVHLPWGSSQGYLLAGEWAAT